jgi:hypothetical protein
MPEIVDGGEITAADLIQLMEESGRVPTYWQELPFDEAALHLRARICPDSLVDELNWHIREIQHVNAKRHVVLRWPVIGRLLRDQHEINRLILISLEKSVGLSESIESELGRLFSRFRKEDRAFWVQRFRYLGRRWRDVTGAIRELREAWEDGRSQRHRLRSRAGQERMNPLIEEGLRALSEISSTLVEIVEGETLMNGFSQPVERQGAFPGNPLNERVESGLWHAAEGRAIRARWENKPRLFRRAVDVQRRLNRIYMIALEENSTILQELAHRIGHFGYLNRLGELKPRQ